MIKLRIVTLESREATGSSDALTGIGSQKWISPRLLMISTLDLIGGDFSDLTSASDEISETEYCEIQ